MDGMTINHIVSIDHGSYGMSFFMVCAVFDKTFSWWQASVNCCCMFPNQFLPQTFCGYRVFSFSLRKIKAESFKGTILSKLVVTENPWKIDSGQTKDICLELPGGIVILSKTNQDLDGSIYVFTCPFIFECSCQSVHGSVLYPTCSAFELLIHDLVTYTNDARSSIVTPKKF